MPRSANVTRSGSAQKRQLAVMQALSCRSVVSRDLIQRERACVRSGEKVLVPRDGPLEGRLELEAWLPAERPDRLRAVETQQVGRGGVASLVLLPAKACAPQRCDAIHDLADRTRIAFRRAAGSAPGAGGGGRRGALGGG